MCLSNFYPVNLLPFLHPSSFHPPLLKTSPKLEKGGSGGALQRKPTMLTQEQLEEVAGVVWAPILKWSRAVGMMGQEEWGAVLFLSILSTSSPPLGKDQVNLTSLPDSCSPPEPQSNSRRGGSCRPPPVCQMCIQLYGCHCGPSCRRHTSHKLLSLRLRQAEKKDLFKSPGHN